MIETIRMGGWSGAVKIQAVCTSSVSPAISDIACRNLLPVQRKIIIIGATRALDLPHSIKEFRRTRVGSKYLSSGRLLEPQHRGR